MRFTSFLSGGFTTMAVINPLERKLAKRTTVHYDGPNLAVRRINSALHAIQFTKFGGTFS